MKHHCLLWLALILIHALGSANGFAGEDLVEGGSKPLAEESAPLVPEDAPEVVESYAGKTVILPIHGVIIPDNTAVRFLLVGRLCHTGP